MNISRRLRRGRRWGRMYILRKVNSVLLSTVVSSTGHQLRCATNCGSKHVL